MRNFIIVIFLLVNCYAFANNTSQTIMLSVEQIDIIGVDVISPINPGMTEDTHLRWTTNGDNRKIFVKVDHVPTNLKSLDMETLTTSLWGSARQSPISSEKVSFSSTGQQELMHNLGGAAGGCVIRYTAEIDPNMSRLSDVVIISYIITNASGVALNVSSHQLVIGTEVPSFKMENNGVITIIDE